MNRPLVHGELIALSSACGGGGNIPAISTASTAPVANTGNGLPHGHGLVADAFQVFPTDGLAGIFADQNGFARSYSTAGAIDTNGPFFKSSGSGRTCASCHLQDSGFSVSAKSAQDRFAQSAGTDPLFQPHDGATSPRATVPTLEDKRSAYNLLLSRGVFRIGLRIPETAKFTLCTADEPYQLANAHDLSLFRRPLPSANLARQAVTANNGHAQALADLSQSEHSPVIAFEKTFFAAQRVDTVAGPLFAANSTGGAAALWRASPFCLVSNISKGFPCMPSVFPGSPFLRRLAPVCIAPSQPSPTRAFTLTTSASPTCRP